MGIANIINTSTSGGGGGEIIRELVNSSDGQGLYFSNTGYIHLANNAAAEFGTSDFSIEFILNQTGEVGSSGGSIYQSATTVNNKFSIENHVSSNVVKLIFFNAVGSATQYDLAYNMAADYNEPTHYVVSCDRSGNAVLYRNGTEVASVSIATSASINLGDGVTSTAMIGNSGSGYTFLGGLYRFRTWNKALSHDEVDTCFQRADVPFADQYGSQTKVIDSDFNGSLDGWNTYNDWNTQTNNSNAMQLAASAATQVCRNNVSLVGGKKYRVEYTASALTGAPTFNCYDSGIYTAKHTITAGSNSFEMDWPVGQSVDFLYIRAESATAAVTLDDIFVYQIGVLTDHDLAFASPTQSAMCQDRANKSDGTMGGTIQQTQKIPQLNATAISVSTATARTPADGDIIADKLGVGIAPAHAATIYGTGAGNATVQIEGEGGADPTINLLTNNTTHWALGVDDSDSDNFKICKHSAIGTTNNYLTIDTAGLVTINKDGLALKIDGTANTARGILLRNTGNQHGYLHTDGNMKLIAEDAGKSMSFYTADDGTGTARMVIDASGNVTQAGGKYVLQDGSGANVGEISNINGNNLTISGVQASHCGFSFATNAILPVTQSSTNTNTVDLGADSNTFKDLHLGGAAKIGGNVLVNGGGYIKIGPSNSTAVLKLYRDDDTISSDAIGDIDFGGGDADNDAAARIRAKADGAWTGSSSPTKLEFSTCPSGSETLATRMTISSAGVIKINTSSDAVATQNTDLGLNLNGSSQGRIYATADAHHDFNRTAAGEMFRFRTATTEVGSISVTASATAYNTSSDYRLKENLEPLTNALDRIEQLPVYRFNFKADPDKTVDGFVAHEAATVVPESIHGEKDAMQTVVVQEAVEAVEYQAAIEAVEYQPATYYEEGDELPVGVSIGDIKTEEIQSVEGQPEIQAVEAQEEVTEEQPLYQGIDQSKLVPLLVAAIKELKAKVEALENA